MPIEKPFAVVPNELSSIATGNELSNRPCAHIGKFKDKGMIWQTSNETNVWARGQFVGGSKGVSFMALLGTNAIDVAHVRLRLGATQADVDFTQTYTASTSFAGYAGALDNSGAALRDNNVADGNGTSSHLSLGAADDWVRIDQGASIMTTNVIFAGFSSLNGCIVEVSNNGTAWSTISTVASSATATLFTVTIGIACRYIRIRQPAAANLWLTEFYVTRPAGYDSNYRLFRNPAIIREDGIYHSFLDMGAVSNAAWWRIDVLRHSGAFSAMALVLGKKLDFGNYYTPDSVSFGQEDYGELAFDRFGVSDEVPGNKMRTLDMDFGWMTDEDRFDKFQPMRDKIGTTGMAFWCFDPEATVQRQDKCYFGPLTKPAFFKPSVFNMSRWQSQFQIRSII